MHECMQLHMLNAHQLYTHKRVPLTPHTGFSVRLSVKEKCHPSYRMHRAKDYSHFSQSWPNCSGWLSYLEDSSSFLFAYKWQSLCLNFLSPWLKECDQSVTDRVLKGVNASDATRKTNTILKHFAILLKRTTQRAAAAWSVGIIGAIVRTEYLTKWQ